MNRHPLLTFILALVSLSMLSGRKSAYYSGMEKSIAEADAFISRLRGA